MKEKAKAKKQPGAELQNVKRGAAKPKEDTAKRKRAEEEASRMVTVVRDSNDAIAIQDFEGRITAWNRGAELMYGYSEAEALQMTILRLVPPNKAAEQKDFNRRIFAGEKVSSFETQRLTKDGRLLDIWLTVTKLVDDAGKVIGIASTERDITDRKRAEETLRRLATVVRDSNDAIIIQDIDGRINAWNRGAELMYGYNEAEALGMNIEHLSPPDKLAEQREFTRRLIAGEAVASFETQRVTKDGRILYVWLTVTKLVEASTDSLISTGRDITRTIGIALIERNITERKRVEEALRTQASVLRLALQIGTIGVFDLDIESGEGHWTPELAEIWGIPTDFEGDFSSFCWEHCDPDDLAWVKEDFARVLQNRVVNTMEFRVRRPDGKTRWIRWCGQVIEGTEGRLSVIGVNQDITDRKKREEAFSSSEAFLNGIIEQSPESLWVSDSEGTMIRMNPACRELFGITDEEVVGKYNLFKDNLIEEQGFMPLVTNVFKKGEIARFTIDYDLPRVEHIKVSGAMHRIIDVVISPIRDLSGKVTNAIIQHKDVTDRKRAEEALRASSIYSRNLLETSLDPLVTISAEGRITDINTATEKITGMSRERLIGSDFSDYFTEPEMARAGYQKVFEQGQVIDYPLAVRHTSGAIIEVLYNASVYRNEQGKVLGVFAAARDITERKRAEEARERLLQSLEEKTKELEQVLYAASHDLRSPLVNIQGFAKEMEHSVEQIRSSLKAADIPTTLREQLSAPLDEDIPEALQYILTSSYKIDSLLGGLLQLSRLGRAELDIKRLNMNKLMESVIHTFEFSIKERGVKLEVGDLPPCLGDETRINQLFSNFIDNALKFLDPDRPGIIKINGTKEGKQAVYCVEDNGIGIAPEYHERVFEIFERLDPTAGAGEGLGLTIVRRIADRHNGRIWLESEPGKGSRFFVSLPAA